MNACLLQEATLVKARNELNEIPGEKEEKVELFRQRIKDAAISDPLLRCTRTDDRMLVRFLRVKKYDVDKALHLYSSYYLFRSVCLYI